MRRRPWMSSAHSIRSSGAGCFRPHPHVSWCTSLKTRQRILPPWTRFHLTANHPSPTQGEARRDPRTIARRMVSSGSIQTVNKIQPTDCRAGRIPVSGQAVNELAASRGGQPAAAVERPKYHTFAADRCLRHRRKYSSERTRPLEQHQGRTAHTGGSEVEAQRCEG